MTRLLRLQPSGRGPRVGRVVEDLVEILDHDEPLRALAGEGAVDEVVGLAGIELLPPIEAPEIWCAGVTYERSRDARLEEAATDARDVYALVYRADRPELFLKDAGMRRTVGPGQPLGLRSDSQWQVPEPELAVVLDERGSPCALTIGNDVSSRDIEGENPLYIPQAKIFAGCCALGPVLIAPDDWTTPRTIEMRILDGDGAVVFFGETSTARMTRTILELTEWLTRDNPVPAGTVLLTGTGLVPDGLSLAGGETVEISVEGIGTLSNPVAQR